MAKSVAVLPIESIIVTVNVALHVAEGLDAHVTGKQLVSLTKKAPEILLPTTLQELVMTENNGLPRVRM